jgi:hypothetical protein
MAITPRPPDYLRMVGDFLRAQHDLVLEAVDFAVELLCRVGTERQRGGGGERHPAGTDQVQHAVLQHLGVGGQTRSSNPASLTSTIEIGAGIKSP